MRSRCRHDKWIDNVRDLMVEILSTPQWYFIAGDSGYHDSFVPIDEDSEVFEQRIELEEMKVEKRLTVLTIKLELMLNSNEDDHNELIKRVTFVVQQCTTNGKWLTADCIDKALDQCKRVLK